VLLIDEIDKADIEFPNDLLQELDRMEFFVYETGETVHARRRPVVVITSNNEKQLRGRGLFLEARHVAHLVEQLQRLRHQALLDAGEMHVDDRAHGVGIGKADIVEEAAAQERVRQLLLDWLKLLMVARSRSVSGPMSSRSEETHSASARRALEK
jgi:MoxR-like ATPase